MKFLTPIILIGISVGLFFFYLNPTYTKIKAAQASLTEYNNAIDRTKAASARRDELVNKYNSISAEDIDRLQKLLPDTIDNIRLLVDINAIAAQYSQGINGIQISTTEDNGTGVIASSSNNPYGTLTLSFNVKMVYSDFQKFLHDLENSLRIIDVSNITFTSNGDTSETRPTYNVTLKTYWLR